MVSTTRAPNGDISNARLRLKRSAAMVPATPLVPTAAPGPQNEILMRLVALESQVERLAARNEWLETSIAHYKTTGTWLAADPNEPEEPAPEPEPAPEEPAPEPEPEAPAEEPAVE